MSAIPRFSNAISNIDINSYRAYKKIIKTDKTNFTEKINQEKSNNINAKLLRNNSNNNIIQARNLTKHIFSSRSLRFKWQTNEALNRNSEIKENFGSIRHQKDLNSDNWEGMRNLTQNENYFQSNEYSTK